MVRGAMSDASAYSARPDRDPSRESADVARQVHRAQAHVEPAAPPRADGEGVTAVTEARRAREHRLALAQHGEGYGRDLVQGADELRGPLGHREGRPQGE